MPGERVSVTMTSLQSHALRLAGTAVQISSSKTVSSFALGHSVCSRLPHAVGSKCWRTACQPPSHFQQNTYLFVEAEHLFVPAWNPHPSEVSGIPELAGQPAPAAYLAQILRMLHRRDDVHAVLQRARDQLLCGRQRTQPHLPHHRIATLQQCSATLKRCDMPIQACTASVPVCRAT